MIIKFYISILTLCIAGYATQAQYFPSEEWHEGDVVLLEGDTLEGTVKYNMETNIVQLKPSQSPTTILAFTGRKLLFFEIYDGGAKRFRQFYALPYPVNPDYKTPILFEVLFEGSNVSLLCREAIEYQVTNYPYSTGGSYSRQVLNYTYYFLKSDGSISDYTPKKKDMIWLMRDRSTQIKKFIKSNRIRPERRADIIKTVSYYNSLFNKPENPNN